MAVRTGGVLKWVLSDHLGSTSITANADGSLQSEMRYRAFGEIRYTNGITPTDYRYTGQLQQAEAGLYFYNARWYDPQLGRFIQADTIVPGARNSKAIDRYAYVLNNPINLKDLNGHDPSCMSTDAWCLAVWDAYGRWASNFYSSSGVATQTNTQSTTLINTCGWGTGATCGDSNANNYNKTRPLSQIADDFNSSTVGTGNVIWHGYVAKGNPKKDALGNTIYREIVDIVSENNKAVIYLVGHSAGTDATIYALYLLSTNNPKMIANIKGVAILDVNLADVDNPETPNIEISKQIGKQVNATYQGKIYYAYSSEYHPPNFDTTGNDLGNQFGHDSHTQLVIDSAVSEAVKIAFGW